MFDDFHETSRSAGIVGMLLGLLVLAGFCGLGMAVMSGNASRKDTSMASKVMDQERMIEQLSKDLAKRKRKLVEAKESVESYKVSQEVSGVIAEQNELCAKHREDLAKMNKGIVETQSEFEEYRDRYRANERDLSLGETLDLSETMGEAYKKCKVIGISPIHLRVMKSSGPVGIDYDKLPSAIQDRFQFSDKEANAYRDKLNQENARRGAQDAVLKRQMDKKRGEMNRQALTKGIAQIDAAILTKSNYAREQEILADEWSDKARAIDKKAAQAKAAGRISMGRGQARQARSMAGQYSKRALQARKEVSQLKKDRAEYGRQLSSSRR